MNNITAAINTDDIDKIDKSLFSEVKVNNIIMLSLMKTIQSLEYKINDGRIKDKETEKIKLEYYKAYINAINCFSNLSKSRNLFFDKDMIKEFFNSDDLEGMEQKERS